MSQYSDEDDIYDSEGNMKDPPPEAAGSSSVTVDDLLDRLESLEDENDELAENNKKLKAINEGLQQNLKKLVVVKADLEDEVDELTDIIKELKQKLADETKETIALDVRNAELEDENDALKKKEKSDREAFDAAAREHAAEIIKLKDAFFELQSKLEIEKKELNDALRKASQEVEDRDAKIAKLSHYKVDLDEEIRVAQERNESLLQKMKGFEKIVEAERRDFRATTHKLQGQVDTLKQQIELEKGSVESRQKINAGQTAELEKLSSIIAELEKAKAALEREKRTMARENDRDKQTITDNERERADLKKQLNKQNDEVQRLRKLLYG